MMQLLRQSRQQILSKISNNMSLIKLNGINLNVYIQGQGLPIIFMHALGCDHSQWQDEAARLSAVFQTIIFDCRGHGQSDKPATFSLDDHINDVLALMDYFSIDKTILYGVSMGSYIAQGVAIAQPQRINKLILTVPKANGLTSSTRKLFAEHAQELAKMNNKERLMFFYKNMAYNPDILIKNPDLLRSTLTPKQSEAANKALEGFDFRNELPKITADTLVISGKHDGLNPPSEGKLCASLIPNSTYVEMQCSAHLPMIEEPETYRSIVNRFLADTL